MLAIYKKIKYLLILIVPSAVTMILLTACDSDSKIYTVGILDVSPTFVPVIKGFKEGMTELGYREEENINYLILKTEGDRTLREPALRQMMAANVDLVFVTGNGPAKDTKQLLTGSQFPAIFAPAINPVGYGIVESIQRPNGNITGVRADGFVSKEFEWLISITPTSKKILMPYFPIDQGSVKSVELLEKIAERLEVELALSEIESNTDQLSTLIHNLPADVDAIFLVPGSRIARSIPMVVEAAIKHKLPLVFHHHHRLQDGLLLSFGPDLFSMGKQAARLAHEVLEGADVGELPVETAEFFLGINLKTAAAIGLEIPDTVLRQAKYIER